MHPGRSLALIAPLLAGRVLAAQAPEPMRICLAPTTVEASGNATAAADAVRETFTSFLTGPSVKSQPLESRLASQAREEAKQAGCPFVLMTTLKLVTKRSGGGVLGQVVAGAARQGAAEVLSGRTGSAAGRIVGSAAYGGVNVAASQYATSIRTRDELSLGWRLESADGSVRGEGRDKRSAKSDGEDLLTPLAQAAAERVLAAAKGGAR